MISGHCEKNRERGTAVRTLAHAGTHSDHCLSELSIVQNSSGAGVAGETAW